jgi:tetratricopeptide (TPR) repeat protein
VVRQALSSINRNDRDTARAFRDARALHAQHRTREAEELYKRVLKSDNRHFPSLYQLGLLYLQQKRFDEAAHSLRRAIKIDRKSAEAHHHLAVALMGLERPEDAVRTYEIALSIRPNLPETHNNLGHALQILGRNQDAIAHYQKALAIRPDYPEGRNNLGNALRALGRVEEAVLQFREALSINPNYLEAHINLGNALAALGDHQAAVTSFDTAIALRPGYAELYHSLGNAHVMMGHHEQAIVSYQTALALQPQDANLHFRLGKAWEALGRRDEALQSHEQALAIDPTHVGALFGREEELRRLGKYAEAAEILEGLIQRGVCSARVLFALANMPASFITVDVLAQLDRVTRQDDEDPETFKSLVGFARAAALDKAGRYAEAWEHLVAANRAAFLASKDGFEEMGRRQAESLLRLRQSSAMQAAPSDDRQVISLFILGPSRSGKTTLENLVSTLVGGKCGYEDSSVQIAVTRTFQAAALPGVPLLENLPPRLLGACRDTYLAEVSERAASSKIFISTHPGRIYDADLIATAFPNARFVLLKRDLNDNLLRIYQRRYKTGNFFSYDLKAARDHILWYHEMMTLLAERFPHIVRALQYEDMIVDPAAAVSAVAELCGIPCRRDPLPAIPDDRGCASKYARYISA